jgi:hypothetical protein
MWITFLKATEKVNLWIVGFFVASGVFLVSGTVSAYSRIPSGSPIGSPFQITLESGDIPLGGACDYGPPYIGFILNGSDGKKYAAPLVLGPAPVDITFDCATNLGPDGCTLPINITTVDVTCGNSPTDINFALADNSFADYFTVSTPSSGSGIDTTIMSNVVASGTSLLTEAAGGTFSFFWWIWPILFGVLALIVIIRLAFKVSYLGSMSNWINYRRWKKYRASENPRRPITKDTYEPANDWLKIYKK